MCQILPSFLVTSHILQEQILDFKSEARIIMMLGLRSAGSHTVHTDS